MAEATNYRVHLMICAGTGCVSNRSLEVKQALEEKIKEAGLDGEIDVVSTGCQGFCAQGPIMVVQPEGIFYEKLTSGDIAEVIEKHLEGGEPVERLLYHHDGAPVPRMEDIPFFGKQKLLALRHKGLINPERIDDYIRLGGYQTIHKVLESSKPDDIVREVIRSGIW